MCVMTMRRQHNSIILQSALRRYRAMRVLQSAQYIGMWTQTHYRGIVGRVIYNELNRERRALQIQTRLRVFVALKRFRKMMDAVLVIQCARRAYSSRLVLSFKKAGARDLSVVVQERDRLKNEVRALKAELQIVKLAMPQVDIYSEDSSNKMKEKENEITSLRSELNRMTAENASKEMELLDARASLDAAIKKTDELEQLNADLQQLIVASQGSYDEVGRLEKDNERVLDETEQVKLLFNQDIENEKSVGQSASNHALPTPVLPQRANLPHTPVTAEVECALEKALAKIAELEEANELLRAESNRAKPNNSKDLVETAFPSSMKRVVHAMSAIEVPSLPDTSVYTSATTDNMTADTDDEIAKLREENQLMRTQLELLRDNQGVLPDIVGSDQEYEASVNPRDSASHSSEEGDESSFLRYDSCVHLFIAFIILTCVVFVVPIYRTR